MIYQEIYKEEKEKRLGRPTLPVSLKKYIKNKHQTKIRKVMKEKYDFFNKYENIKNNLLSKEEFEEIKSKIDNKSILRKLFNLQI
jgi:replicative DNA helicase